MISLRGIQKNYGTLRALHDISVDLPSRRTTVLIGPSGSGKSTLLRIMMGLIVPDSGVVDWDGTPITAETALELRRKMGYMRQDGGLFPHLTARDNVEIMPDFLKWDKARRMARTAELCELTRFPGHMLDKYPAQLSGGQRQRVSLIRALMLDPILLLLDEPLGALDPITRRELQEELHGLFKRLGKTVVAVTHDLSEAGYLGDNLVLLSEGRIVQQGPLRELIERPANDFVKQFVGAQRSLVEVLFS